MTSLGVSAHDAMEEACSSRYNAYYTDKVLMTLQENKITGPTVKDEVFIYGPASSRLHGLLSPLCPNCGSNTLIRNKSTMFLFKCA